MDLLSLIFGTADTLLTAVYFVIALMIIVFVHEYGHYIVGRWCGIHAEVFSLGFGPVIRSWQDRRGTRWQVAAIPFGGYVRFLGDADSASAPDAAALGAMAAEQRSRSMHGAPLPARALTVAAGPVFNFILSITVFAALALYTGVAVEPPTIKSLKLLPEAQSGLRPGDVLKAINGTGITGYEAFFAYAGDADPAQPQKYLVERGGVTLEVAGPFPLPPIIGGVTPRSAAADAGLRLDDVVLAVDGTEIRAFSQLQALVKASAGAPVQLTIWRDGTVRDVALSARVTDLPDGEGGFEQRVLIGVYAAQFFEPATNTPGPVALISTGITSTWGIVTGSLSGLRHVIIGAISTCNLQGPLGIAETTGDAARQGIESFVFIIAALSTAIGLVNLFPIPVLDGGHLVFFAYEAIARRKPSDRAVNFLMATGLALIIAMMVFALSNDIFCP